LEGIPAGHYIFFGHIQNRFQSKNYLGVPFAKAAVRLFALFPIRKTTAEKSLVFLKREIPLLSLTQKKSTSMISFAMPKE
jgi:hypothetical protein